MNYSLRTTWTVFCKLPSDGRGQYSEEVDVLATSRSEALREAQKVLDKDYLPELRPVRTMQRVNGYWF